MSVVNDSVEEEVINERGWGEGVIDERGWGEGL